MATVGCGGAIAALIASNPHLVAGAVSAAPHVLRQVVVAGAPLETVFAGAMLYYLADRYGTCCKRGLVQTETEPQYGPVLPESSDEDRA